LCKHHSKAFLVYVPNLKISLLFFFHTSWKTYASYISSWNRECNSVSNILFHRCIENYTGARCEEVFLPSSSIQTKSDLFTAFVALTVLLGTLILGALYFLCRKGHLQRASSVQYDINLVETSSTSVPHRFS
uniref:Neuregulin 4 n=1 Tax=Bos mutus grunniens TaxID=30521 RepID=A0A8C0AHH3_BOSMU